MSAPITGYQVEAYRLPLLKPWRSRHGVLAQRRGWRVALITADGRRGEGDCAPFPEAGTESHAAAQNRLELQLPGFLKGHPEQVLERLPWPADCPAARYALESALLDLVSQSAALPLRRWLEPAAPSEIPVNAAVGPLSDALPALIAADGEAGCQVVKLKLGLAPPEQELAQLRRLCRHLPPHVRLRLDANRAWTDAAAQRFVDGLDGLPVEALEEPLRQPVPLSLARLQNAAAFDIALDETLAEWLPERPLEYSCVRRLVLKPTLLGGIGPLLSLARQVRSAGMTTVITSTLESAVGLWGAAQLAAADLALPGSHPPHGLNTARWFSRDLGLPPPVDRGMMRMNDLSGLGWRALVEP